MTERWGVASDRADEPVVRGAPNGEAAQTQPPDGGIAGSGHASAGRDQAEQERARHDRSTEFPVSMEAVVGEKLRVVPIDPKRSAWAGYDVSPPAAAQGRLAPVVGQSSRVWSVRKVLGV
jgi:hypothetical protein